MFPFVIMLISDDDDRAYMEELYLNYKRLMYGVAYKAVRDPYVVEEIVSDGCIALVKNIDTLKELEIPQIRSYIVITIKSKIRDYFDRKEVQLRRYCPLDSVDFNTPDQSVNIEQYILLKEEIAMVIAAIHALPEKERQVVIMKYQEGLDYRTISQKVGISETSVHKYLSRARNRIRTKIYGKEV